VDGPKKRKISRRLAASALNGDQSGELVTESLTHHGKRQRIVSVEEKLGRLWLIVIPK
jgi:hypothetical protein